MIWLISLLKNIMRYHLILKKRKETAKQFNRMEINSVQINHLASVLKILSPTLAVKILV